MNPAALRLYALAFLPVIIAVAWFSFSRGHDEPGPHVRIRDRSFSAEIADSVESKRRGLSGRDSFCGDCVMLFRFDRPGNYGFWMKGMRFPIDIAWVRDGHIVHIERNVLPDHVGTMYPGTDATEVIETNAGALVGAEVGSEVTFQDIGTSS